MTDCPAVTASAPHALRRMVELIRHGDVRRDPWYWLNDRNDPEVIAYLDAENEYTETVLAPTVSLQEQIFNEIRERIQETDVSPPARKGDWDYFTRTFEGSQYAWHGRRPTGAPAGTDEQVILDENELGADLEYFSLGGFAVSPNQRLLAYSFDDDGGERHRLRFRDIETGADLADEIPETYYGISWADDNETIFYVLPDEAMRPFEVWRHTLGTAEDVRVFHEPDERCFLSVGRTRSGGVIVIGSDSKLTSEVHLIDPTDPTRPPRIVEPRTEDVEYSVDHHRDAEGNDSLFIVTNVDGAKNFKVMRAPLATPGRAQWTEVLGHRDDVKIDDIDVFRDAVVVSERCAGLEQLHVIGLTGDPFDRLVAMDDPVYSVWSGHNLEFVTDHFRFGYTSLVIPPSAYDEPLRGGSRTLVKRTEVLGGYDPERYSSVRLWATAPDGTQIPMSVVHRRDLVLDGSAPALVYGYGSYESSIDPTFSSIRLSLLERGYVFAIAHIRGGGELGRSWYEQGRLQSKRNTFEDFIACAEHLCAAGYTAPERLAARGGSAGGLLMGAVVNQRPDLFRAAVAEVPFVDVVTTMQDVDLPLTVTEWEEWGNPLDDPAAYDYMKSYSPYDNVVPQEYPALLVTAGLNDPRVSYWEPAKWVAKLRATKTDDRTLLLKTEMGAGHGGPSGRYDAWRDEAMVLAFLITELTGATS
ncbi:MAG: S9 family peptidase [Acidimicrobiia bacterium]|nr:S9 family peptidase [Acidimicrobiia bacterium]